MIEYTIGGTVVLLLTIFAIYLSVRCNGGIDLVGLLGAILCPYIYIPYKLATCGTGVLTN